MARAADVVQCCRSCGGTAFAPVFKALPACWSIEGEPLPRIAVLRCKGCGKLSWAPQREKGSIAV